VLAQRRHQVTGIGRAPPPVVTGYVAQAKQCPCCAAVTEGLPPFVRARAAGGMRYVHLACTAYPASTRFGPGQTISARVTP
jgi:hypothetical protein